MNPQITRYNAVEDRRSARSTADNSVDRRRGPECKLPTCPWASCRRSWREVPNVTNINSDVFATRVLAAEPWRTRLGAFCPRPSFPGSSVSGVGGGVQSAPRVRGKVSLAVPAPQAVLMAQLGQPNNSIHMTSVYAVGEGASGPPPYREPA